MKLSTSPTKRLVAKTLSFVFIWMLLAATSLTFAAPLPTEDANKSQKAIVLSEPSLESLFEYQIESRPDPFVPFISEKSSSTNINEILPVATQLSGMQLFEPGQLNLVAIVMAGDTDFAMAEDTTGKGYILNTGMKIGKRGIISAIKSNEVTIEETAFTRAGKKLTSTIVMLLKKEGEE